MNKCIDCKYCDEEGLCTSNRDEECYGDAYQQGRLDAIEECIKLIQKQFEYTDNQGLPHYALYAWINLTSVRDRLDKLKE